MIGNPTQSLAAAAAPVSMPLAPPMPPPPQMHFNSSTASHSSAPSSAGGTFLNFNNPSVQEALDKLMKNGSGNLMGVPGSRMDDKDRGDVQPAMQMPCHDMTGFGQYPQAGGYEYQQYPPSSRNDAKSYEQQAYEQQFTSSGRRY